MSASAPETSPGQAKARKRAARSGRPLIAVKILVQTVAWSSAAGFIYLVSWHELGIVVGFLGLSCVIAMAMLERWAERQRWVQPIEKMATKVRAISADPEQPIEPVDNPQLTELVRAVSEMRGKLISMREPGSLRGEIDQSLSPSSEFESVLASSLMAKSGTYDAPDLSTLAGSHDGEDTEMVSRLDIKTLRWINSSAAEQAFLGWPMPVLQHKFFLDMIDLSERELARAQFNAAIQKGEGHNLLYRIHTARDEIKTVELHLAVRYSRADADHRPKPIYLKVRMTDMTKKVHAEREVRKHTRELVDINQQLRRMNRELESLKNRYSDLYHRAPSLYLSLDPSGVITECNDTLLQSLGRDRESTVGSHYVALETPEHKGAFSDWFDQLKTTGSAEIETRWTKSDGEAIDVALDTRSVTASDGSFRSALCVGRDVTSKRLLEAQVRHRGEQLAHANAELSRKNKELDEFAYIVAHDLKEPLRTLTAFSGFLEKDCGDKIGDVGHESLRHIVEAARRMRALIDDLQTLSRAGKVTGDFVAVDLNAIIDRTRADFAEQLRTRNGSIVTPRPLPEVFGDSTRIIQLISNLVGNALKYNQSPQPVVEIETVDVETLERLIPEGFITLVVRDNGIGIDPKFHGKIFQLFRRLHARDEYDGTGAGLAICLKIVEAHGGSIWVESQLGQGSKFYLTLPAVLD